MESAVSNTSNLSGRRSVPPKKNHKVTLLLSLLGVYLLSSGISMGAFTLLAGKGVNLNIENLRSRVDLSQPKTEACPMNGLKYTKDEKKIWDDRRPITAIIENHLDSRPQSGLSKADIIYEAVAEGGITRFMAIFYCGASEADVRIGPIRSARIYFINWAAEYANKPLFVHVGGANNICSSCPGGVKPAGTTAREVRAIEELITLGWRFAKGNALDAGTNVGFPVVWRDYERIPGAATEHTFMGSTDKLFEEAEKRGFGFKGSDGKRWDENFVQWNFSDSKSASGAKHADISFKFWNNKPEYDVTWKYNSDSNQYLRFNGGKEHVDMDTKQQLSAKNIVIQFVREQGPVDKEGHMLYTNIGTGRILLFQNGQVQEGTWSKRTQNSRTEYKVNGRDVEFVPGTIWIEALPIGNNVSY